MSDATSSKQEATTSTLRRNALGLRHAIVISVAVMSPAASIFFNTIPQAGVVGAAIPLCYVIGFVVALLVANQYSEFSREIPSSGSAYTFVTEGLGRPLGFMTAWIGLIAIAIGVPYSFILLGANLQALVMRWFGINLHWSFWFVLALGIAFALCYWGIRQSMNVDLTFLVFEMGICLVLAVIVLFQVGQHGGLTAAPFSPSSIPQGGDLTIGIVLAVLSFIGFEAAAALGEETRDPHRNIPRAVFGSMIVVGLFYVLMAYVGTVGYGINHMVTGFANDPAPFDTIGRQYSGSFFVVLIDLVGSLSFFGAALAIINGGSRILYTVGRDGLLPPWTAWLHPVRQNPVGSIAALCVFWLPGFPRRALRPHHLRPRLHSQYHILLAQAARTLQRTTSRGNPRAWHLTYRGYFRGPGHHTSAAATRPHPLRPGRLGPARHSADVCLAPQNGRDHIGKTA